MNLAIDSTVMWRFAISRSLNFELNLAPGSARRSGVSASGSPRFAGTSWTWCGGDKVGVARRVGSLPNPDVFADGDLELDHVNPPLWGYNVIAASKSLWAVSLAPADSPAPPEDPVSSTAWPERVYTSSERRRCPGSADGRPPGRALADLGYEVKSGGD